MNQGELRDPSAEGRISVRQFSRIAVVTIRRPIAHNALTSRMWQDLRKIGDEIANNPKTRVVLLRGAFDYFTAGSDIKEFSQMSVEQVDRTFAIMEEAISTLENLPFPTIACIKGTAMGAGLQLALACDLRVASENARLGMPVARLGITIGAPFARRLVDLVGPSWAKDMLFTGRALSVQEATRLGLVNYTTSSGKVEYFALRLARTIANQSTASVRNSKQMVSKCLPKRELADLPVESPRWIDSTDFQEGVKAFIEKRVPNFKRLTKKTKSHKN